MEGKRDRERRKDACYIIKKSSFYQHVPTVVFLADRLCSYYQPVFLGAGSLWQMQSRNFGDRAAIQRERVTFPGWMAAPPQNCLYAFLAGARREGEREKSPFLPSSQCSTLYAGSSLCLEDVEFFTDTVRSSNLTELYLQLKIHQEWRIMQCVSQDGSLGTRNAVCASLDS